MAFYRIKYLVLGGLFCLCTWVAKALPPDTTLSKYNVSWNSAGPTSAQSMPLGNGDIGLNVWVEPAGDLMFYISKTDAWGDGSNEKDNWMKQGGVLMKLGAVRVSAGLKDIAHFRQILRLTQAEILVNESNAKQNITYRIWVDANNPVIRVEVNSKLPASVNVKLEDWRAGKTDTIIDGQTNRIAWYHHNPATADPHLAKLTFGAVISGRGFVNLKNNEIRSAKNTTSQMFSVYPLTSVSSSAANWYQALNQQINKINRNNFEQMRSKHLKWWQQFWNRSHVFVTGDTLADKVTQGYILQRFVTACAGRGKYPIKFNGSIFIVDYPRLGNDADHRSWGGQYWFQNTRAMYWPRLAAGDFDIMRPLFAMYRNILPANEAQVNAFYKHGGAYFAETAPFWGGLQYMGAEVKANYTNHYFTPILELSMMMLDYYEYTGNVRFAADTLIPVATAGLRFFDEHFKRDTAGRLLLDPDNAIEMFWKVHDPAPDVAGLRAVLTRMINLDSTLTDHKDRQKWQKLLRELPAFPVGSADGKPVLLPYTGPQTAQSFNSENPELYAIYPFRLYGLGTPGIDTAINTFNARKQRAEGCWVQDPIQAAMVGNAAVAKAYTSFALTRKDPELKFPAFWAKGNDYMPDEDNGGNGENGLQQMLMQCRGKKIMLLPAWPIGWDANFKLNAPYSTVVEGSVTNGHLTILRVTPASRMADIVDMSKK